MAHIATELSIQGGIDTVRLLDAQDRKIFVPFWNSYIPYGLRESQISPDPDWLYVERAKEIGDHAVRLFWCNDSEQTFTEEFEEPDEPTREAFGVVTYNNSIERQYVTTQKTRDIIFESESKLDNAKWNVILTTESNLSDAEKKLFERMLGKLSLQIRTRYNERRL